MGSERSWKKAVGCRQGSELRGEFSSTHFRPYSRNSREPNGDKISRASKFRHVKDSASAAVRSLSVTGEGQNPAFPSQ